MKQVFEITIDTDEPWNFGLAVGSVAAKLASEYGPGFVVEGLLETAARLQAEYFPLGTFDETSLRFADSAKVTIDGVLMEINPEWSPIGDE